MRGFSATVFLVVLVLSLVPAYAQSRTFRGIVAEITQGPPLRIVVSSSEQRISVTLAETAVVQRRDDSGRFVQTAPGDIRLGDEVILSLEGDIVIAVSILTPRSAQPVPPVPPPIVAPPALTAFSTPEETIIAYYNQIFMPIQFADHRDEIDRRYCRAYALLSKQTHAQISLYEFVNAIWDIRIAVGRRAMNLGTTTYNDDRTIAKVVVTLHLDSWLAGDLGQQTGVVTLVKEEGSWRIVLQPETVLDYKARAARTGAKHNPKC